MKECINLPFFFFFPLSLRFDHVYVFGIIFFRLKFYMILRQLTVMNLI